MSKCPGDFSYYKTESATFRFAPGGVPYTPCGMIGGTVFTIGAGPDQGYNTCRIPSGEQWYLNWRVVGGCPANRGLTCGHVMAWHWNY